MKNTEIRKNRIYTTLLFFSLVVFAVSQLVVNSILTPLGTKLQTLNSEKEYILEENREISEEIAKNGSIRVVEKLSEKKLHLSQDKKQSFIYIEDPSLVANN